MKDVQVKICGLTNADDAAAALELGADYLGFVLFSGSPRGIDAPRLARILERVDADGRAVAVFVNTPRADVELIAADCGLCAVQIHGDEPSDEFRDMPLPVWRAVRVETAACVPQPGCWPAERYVVDAHVPGSYGGTGKTADWTAAGRLARRLPVMLAGGLTADNVAAAVRLVAPLGVDTSSGVESGPGHKDHGKMRDFIRAARQARRNAGEDGQ